MDLTPSVENLTIYRGDTLPLSFTVTDPATDQPVDITDRDYQLVVVVHANEEPVYAVAGTITDAPSGEFAVALTATQTSDMDPGTLYRYHVREVNGAVVTTLLRGLLTIVDDAGLTQ